MQISELQSMTVIQLRKIARESGIKLSAGIDKEGIVERISAALPLETAVDTTPKETMPKAVEEKLQGTPLSADVTSVEPRSEGVSAWQARQASNPGQSVYKQAWQARQNTFASSRQPAQKSAWGQQQRPVVSTQSRFGPRVNYIQNPVAGTELASGEETKQDAQDLENLPKLDGYKLGYRAAPQKPAYHRSEHHAVYRPENSQRQQNYMPPPTFHSGSVYVNDALYKPTRDPAFAEPYVKGEPLPDLLVAENGEPASGVLEILPDGYGFLRQKTLMPGKKDIYVSIAQIRRYNLRTGDYVVGLSRPKEENDRFAALLFVEKINGVEAAAKKQRLTFESLTPIYPDKRIMLENGQNDKRKAIRLVDLIAPIGFGQRGMVIAPPNSGQLDMLCEIGKAMKESNPDIYLMVLMVDTAVEEVTQMREALDAEVFAATFGETPESQTRVSETMLERAERLVEDGKDVVILLDSLTKLTRAYQFASGQGNRPISNTVTPSALAKPKSFFSTARNTREAGSLTIIATIAVETGSRVDDIIFEEFKGSANMELRLCEPSPDEPLTPMIDLQRSFTKKEDMLLDEDAQESLFAIRTMLSRNANQDAVVQIVEMMEKTKCNADFFIRLKEWVALWEKSGLLRR